MRLSYERLIGGRSGAILGPHWNRNFVLEKSHKSISNITRTRLHIFKMQRVFVTIQFFCFRSYGKFSLSLSLLFFFFFYPHYSAKIKVL